MSKLALAISLMLSLASCAPLPPTPSPVSPQEPEDNDCSLLVVMQGVQDRCCYAFCKEKQYSVELYKACASESLDRNHCAISSRIVAGSTYTSCGCK